jgi:geranylgeranyl reductase family protein
MTCGAAVEGNRTVALEPVPRQHPAEAAAGETWDALVVGAGPAGSTAALHLAAAGRRVLLLDRERFPRDKTCGDLLIADALQALERAGLSRAVEEIGHEVRSMAVFSPSRIRVDVQGRFFTLRRRLLDALIAHKAVEAGAVFCRGEVRRIEHAATGGVTCALGGTERTVGGRVGVVATGAGVELLENLGLPVRRRASAMAARCYVRSPQGPRDLVVSFDRAIIPGYAWIFPLGNDEYNVGCGVFVASPACAPANLRHLFTRFLAAFPPAVELMRRGELLSPLQGARLRCGLQGACQDGTGNLLAVGETIGATYPLTGEGIGKAMRTGELAAEAVHGALKSADWGRLRDFPARLEAELRSRYRGYQRAERWVSRPWLCDLMARCMRRSRFLRASMAAVLDETLDPGAVFSLGAMVQSLWK